MQIWTYLSFSGNPYRGGVVESDVKSLADEALSSSSISLKTFATISRSSWVMPRFLAICSAVAGTMMCFFILGTLPHSRRLGKTYGPRESPSGHVEARGQCA